MIVRYEAMPCDTLGQLRDWLKWVRQLGYRPREISITEEVEFTMLDELKPLYHEGGVQRLGHLYGIPVKHLEGTSRTVELA